MSEVGVTRFRRTESGLKGRSDCRLFDAKQEGNGAAQEQPAPAMLHLTIAFHDATVNAQQTRKRIKTNCELLKPALHNEKKFAATKQKMRAKRMHMYNTGAQSRAQIPGVRTTEAQHKTGRKQT